MHRLKLIFFVAASLAQILRSFLPPGGSIRRVTVYLSDFGKERLAEEVRRVTAVQKTAAVIIMGGSVEAPSAREAPVGPTMRRAPAQERYGPRAAFDKEGGDDDDDEEEDG